MNLGENILGQTTVIVEMKARIQESLQPFFTQQTKMASDIDKIKRGLERKDSEEDTLSSSLQKLQIQQEKSQANFVKEFASATPKWTGQFMSDMLKQVEKTTDPACLRCLFQAFPKLFLRFSLGFVKSRWRCTLIRRPHRPSMPALPFPSFS